MNTFWINRYFPFLLILTGIAFFWSGAMLNICFYLTAFSSLILLFRTEKTERKYLISTIFKHSTFILMLVWLFFLYLSAFYNHNSPEHISMIASKYKKYFFVFFYIYLWLFLLRQKIDLTRYITLGLVIGAFATAIFAIMVKLFHIQLPFDLHISDGGYVFSAGAFVSALLYTAIMGIGFYLIYIKKYIAGIVLLILGLFGVFILLSQRTAYITAVLLLLWLIFNLIHAKPIKFLLVFISVAGIVSVLATDNTVSKRMKMAYSDYQSCIHYIVSHNDSQIITHCETSNGKRLLFWHDAIQQIKQSPIYGHGLGSADVRNIYDGEIIPHQPNPHQEYLLQGVQIGIIGILLVIAMFVMTGINALLINNNRRYLYAGLVWVYMVSCLFNSFLLDSAEGIFFVILFAAIAGEYLYTYTECRRNILKK